VKIAMLARKTLNRIFPRLARSLHVAVLLLTLGCVVALQGQEPTRKVIARTAPSYPELAKRMHLTGKVKLEVRITAGGSVTSAKLLGGNPVFEKSAIEAVRQWKFEAAQKETTSVIVLEFTDPSA
jgi:TonB family protein